MTPLVRGIQTEMVQVHLQSRKKLTDLENELTVPEGKDGGKE